MKGGHSLSARLSLMENHWSSFWGKCELGLGWGTCSPGPSCSHAPSAYSGKYPPTHAFTHRRVHSTYCVLGSLGGGYGEESKMQQRSGLALPLGLPDSEYNFCLLLTVFPQRTPVVLKSLGCPVRDLYTEG